MSLVPGVPLEVEREKVVAELSRHFAADRLTMEQLEERLALVYSARSSGDLSRLLADLPAAIAVPASTVAVASPDDVQPRRLVIAVMGEVQRRGAWNVPRNLILFAVMGQARIDLRLATFPPGMTTITAVGLMSEITIIVPPGIAIEADGIALMGTVDSVAELGVSAPGHPTLRIRGLAMMSTIDVKIRGPGEK